jgi:cold shock CspA family protein
VPGVKLEPAGGGRPRWCPPCQPAPSSVVGPKNPAAVDYSAITSSGFRSLEENQKVQYDVVQGQKGPQAENISPL